VKKIAFVHILPLEDYPPATHIIDFFSKHFEEILVISSNNNFGRKEYKNQKLKINRIIYPGYEKTKLKKILRSLTTLVYSVWKLLIFKPDVIIYVEPHSALSVYFYMRYINPNVELIIHNHELYLDSDFQKTGMRSLRLTHKMEKRFLYKKAKWISQTNKNRLNYFREENTNLSNEVLKTLANYPPSHWQYKIKKEKKNTEKTRLVYVGVLSFENTYIKEIVEFVSKHNKSFDFTIYCYNASPEIRTYLKKQQDNIMFVESGIAYHDIPVNLSMFDVGLILHKGHNSNYVYNAPNKLFEYLACGLSVIFPEQIIGCHEYIREEKLPFIKSLNFQDLNIKTVKKIISDESTSEFQPTSYYCEKELSKLIAFINRT